MCQENGLFEVKDEDNKRLVAMATNDMYKRPSDPFSSPEYLHEWVVKERER